MSLMRRSNSCLARLIEAESSVPSTGKGSALASNGCETSMAVGVGAATTEFGSAGVSQSIMDGVFGLGVNHFNGVGKPPIDGDAGALAADGPCTLVLRDLGAVGDAFDVAPHSTDCFLDRSSAAPTLPLAGGVSLCESPLGVSRGSGMDRRRPVDGTSPS